MSKLHPFVEVSCIDGTYLVSNRRFLVQKVPNLKFLFCFDQKGSSQSTEFELADTCQLKNQRKWLRAVADRCVKVLYLWVFSPFIKDQTHNI